jgi:hypothetical protein
MMTFCYNDEKIDLTIFRLDTTQKKKYRELSWFMVIHL